MSDEPTRRLPPEGAAPPAMQSAPTRRLPSTEPAPPALCPRCGAALEQREVPFLSPQLGRIFPACLIYIRAICSACDYRQPPTQVQPSHWEQEVDLLANALRDSPDISREVLRLLVQYLQTVQIADEQMLETWQGFPLSGPDPTAAAAHIAFERADRPYRPVEWFQQCLAEQASAFAAAAQATHDPFRQALWQFNQGVCSVLAGDLAGARTTLEVAYEAGGAALLACYQAVFGSGPLQELFKPRGHDLALLRHRQRIAFRRRCGPVLQLLQALENLAAQAPGLGLTLWGELAPEVVPWLDPLNDE
jgi:hypothetical protein